MFNSKHRIFRGTQTNESIFREVRGKWRGNLKSYKTGTAKEGIYF